MANEVIISGYGLSKCLTNGTVMPVYGGAVSSEVLDIGVLSSVLASGVRIVRLQSKGVGFWYKVGESDVSAAANTAGSHWLPADQHVDLEIDGVNRYIDTAADV